MPRPGSEASNRSLSGSISTIFTGRLERSWGRACHLAGANCLLSNSGGEDRTAIGLLHGLRSGCFTDPAFEAA
jgi:hypothetical protein